MDLKDQQDLQDQLVLQETEEHLVCLDQLGLWEQEEPRDLREKGEILGHQVKKALLGYLGYKVHQGLLDQGEKEEKRGLLAKKASLE